MTEPEAFRWIQRTAMDLRTSMKAARPEVVASTESARRSLARLTVRREAESADARCPSARVTQRSTADHETVTT